ncbi:hypothetical protein [Nitrogeniibacter aestuarii]|uniref:hypothetical protein n=1 Tax=Nitrogeniibacter aestuarii TaxID=2815343 RepID=UPI001D0F8D4A|nr:hypothetical protein [Nitrogeniibacter aestuarii]
MTEILDKKQKAPVEPGLLIRVSISPAPGPGRQDPGVHERTPSVLAGCDLLSDGVGHLGVLKVGIDKLGADAEGINRVCQGPRDDSISPMEGLQAVPSGDFLCRCGRFFNRDKKSARAGFDMSCNIFRK